MTDFELVRAFLVMWGFWAVLTVADLLVHGRKVKR